MRYGILFGGGIVIYAIMFLLWSAFVTYGFVEGYAPRILAFIVLVLISLIAGKKLRARSGSDILPYSLSWACMMAGIDAILTVPIAGWGIYYDLNLWFGYALVAVVPLFASLGHAQNRPR